MPELGVVIPCYNHAHYLKGAIDSALRLDVDLEIVVINDGSSDDTEKVIASFSDKRVRSIHFPENRGKSIARNTGIEALDCDYIIPLDADDVLMLSGFRAALQKIRAAETESVIYGNVLIAANDGGNAIWNTSTCNPLAIRYFTQFSGCSLFSRNLWRWSGGYCPEITNYEDWAFWVSCLRVGAEFQHSNEVLFGYRTESLNSKNRKGRWKHEWTVAKIYSLNPKLYLPEDMMLSAAFLQEFPTPLPFKELDRIEVISRYMKEFPYAVSRMIVSYPRLYPEYMRDNTFSALRGELRAFGLVQSIFNPRLREVEQQEFDDA